MCGQEEVLSLDLEDNDFLYRIRRKSRIVYVSVLHEDIIPSEERTDGSRILSNLRAVPNWNGDWTTLTIRKTPKGVIETTVDEFPPHSLNTAVIHGKDAPYFNILDLVPFSRISDRVSRVVLGDKTLVLKIARFRHEVPALQREVSTYALLASRGFPLAPKVIGYAYEGTINRTIGLLMEDIAGSTPGSGDLEDCQITARLLHDYGILHRDLNRYNFLMTDHGAIVFDFEVAVVKEHGGRGIKRRTYKPSEEV
ncbi:hypothetical protein POX_c04611 [Penicillium oxalicum]|uniref:hypothetical protein n=1 Tax=Penicillium oxalicum TaxID=69781 RepID=UPI0020B8E811|nr:hypothetical protein POX_c04611 [Penicillium oxalicum]KAI2791734.1 hypothetical protein POX_c04611 [Penicillium oxalicum]